jgi:hypothetical protein
MVSSAALGLTACTTANRNSDEGLTFRPVTGEAACGTSGAVEDPYHRGICLLLGDAVFGPDDIKKAVLAHDDLAIDPVTCVGLTMTHAASTAFAKYVYALEPGQAQRYLFLYRGTPLGFTSLPQNDATICILTKTLSMAERIVGSVRSN